MNECKRFLRCQECEECLGCQECKKHLERLTNTQEVLDYMVEKGQIDVICENCKRILDVKSHLADYVKRHCHWCKNEVEFIYALPDQHN
jgi:hypothetical protein